MGDADPTSVPESDASDDTTENVVETEVVSETVGVLASNGVVVLLVDVGDDGRDGGPAIVFCGLGALG